MSDLTVKTAQNIERAQSSISGCANGVGMDLAVLAAQAAVCAVSPLLMERSEEMKKRFISLDEKLRRAATNAYGLAGSDKRGSAAPTSYSTACGQEWRVRIRINETEARDRLSDLKARAGRLREYRDMLRTAEREIRDVRAPEQDISSLTGLEKVMGVGGVNGRTLVEMVRDSAAESLRQAGKELDRILSFLGKVSSFGPYVVDKFLAAEEKAKLAPYEEVLTQSVGISGNADPSAVRGQIAALTAAQADYREFYGTSSPAIEGEIARLVDLVIRQAMKDVGNGGQKYKDWFFNHYGGLNPSGNFAWCDRYVSWFIGQLGFKMKAGGCGYQRKEFKKYGGWHEEPDYKPKNGDIVFFNWDGGNGAAHVGVVHIADDGEIYILQGNYGNKVDYVKLSDQLKDKTGKKHVLGYGDPTCLPRL